MEINKAISRLKYRIDTATDIAGKGVDGKAYEDMEMAISALEKQLAKKPLSRTHCKDGNHPFSSDIGRCPCCNSIVAEDMIWCDDCGQKLDWSDNNG